MPDYPAGKNRIRDREPVELFFLFAIIAKMGFTDGFS
jgi:hypothetical protein